MTTSDPLTRGDDVVLRLAVSAYLAWFTGTSRVHTESDLRIYFAWCASHQLAPLDVARVDVERYVRWAQEIRRFKPSTISRRMSVVTGFYRLFVIDTVLEHSPADHVRRPGGSQRVAHLGVVAPAIEALLTAARNSTNPFGFALVAMLGLLGLRISEASHADIAGLGEEHGHRVLRVVGKGTKYALVPLPPASGRASTVQGETTRSGTTE